MRRPNFKLIKQSCGLCLFCMKGICRKIKPNIPVPGNGFCTLFEYNKYRGDNSDEEVTEIHFYKR